MPRGREFLERFRPVGTPGAAAARGVPADRVAELATELAPVFDLLEATQQRTTSLRAQADTWAARHRAQAREAAQAELAAARRRAESERVATAAELTRLADREAEQALVYARAEAEAVHALAAERMAEQAAAAHALMVARIADLRAGAP